MSIGVGSPPLTSPGPGSLNDLRRYVLDYIQGGDDDQLLEVATRSINTAIDMLNMRLFNRIVNNYIITLVTDQAEYELPLDFKEPRYCALLDADSKQNGRLVYQQARYFLEQTTISVVSGSPAIYTIFHDQERRLTLDYAPTEGYVGRHPYARLRYFMRLPYLRYPADTLVGPPELRAIIGWYGRDEIASIRGSASSAREANSMWRSLLRDFTADDGMQGDYE